MRVHNLRTPICYTHGMDSMAQILQTLSSFLVQLATLIVNFLVSVLELLLQFIKTISGSA